MRKLLFSSLFDIQLFGEGGGDGGTGAGTAGEGPAGAESAPAQPKGARNNPLADVKYGKQEAASGAPAQEVTDGRRSEFEAMIKGEYKDLYDERVQNTIQKRLKGQEETIARYNALAPVMEMLAGKYGVDVGDVDALSKAIEEDETFYEDEALEKGLTVQQVKEIRKMQRENEALKQQMDQARQQERADQIIAQWQTEAEAVKKTYPSFDLEAELQNDQFRKLLTSNVDVQTAFLVVHKDEIIPAAMQFTANKIEEKVANKVRAGQMRPQEGAMSQRSPVQVKSDVSKLTKEDRREIERRVARGERISF